MPIQQSVNEISTACKQFVNKPFMILECPFGIVAPVFPKACQGGRAWHLSGYKYRLRFGELGLQLVTEAGRGQPGREESPVDFALMLEEGISGVAAYGSDVIVQLLPLELDGPQV